MRVGFFQTTAVHKFPPIVTAIKIPAVSPASMSANNNICGSALIESDFIGWSDSYCCPQAVASAAQCSNAVEFIQSVPSINLARQNDAAKGFGCPMLSNNRRFVMNKAKLGFTEWNSIWVGINFRVNLVFKFLWKNRRVSRFSRYLWHLNQSFYVYNYIR